jgi:hypothetical protein
VNVRKILTREINARFARGLTSWITALSDRTYDERNCLSLGWRAVRLWR